MTTTDEAIRHAASFYLGSLYDGQRPRVAHASQWIPAQLVSNDPAPGTSCSPFAGAVVIDAFPMARWSSQSWADLQIMDAARPWSPIAAVVAAGIGSEVGRPMSGRWHYCQGWSGLDNGRIVATSGGHSWLCYGDDLILQASSAAGRVTWTRREWTQSLGRYGSGVRVAVLP